MLDTLALWLGTRFSMFTGKELHWRLEKLATEKDYRAPVTAKLGNGLRCTVPWIDDAGKAICASGWYEPESVAVIAGLLTPGATFIDIGAAFGQYTLLASKLVGPQGRIIAFEPEPINYQWLCKNARLNNLNNVDLQSCALGEKRDELELYIGSPENLGTTSFKKQYNFSGRSVKVPVRTLDSQISTADVIKLDVEGAELSVLKGAQRILKSRPALVIEFEEGNQQRFGLSCVDVEKFLLDHGYELQEITPDGLHPYVREKILAQETCNVLATANSAE